MGDRLTQLQDAVDQVDIPLEHGSCDRIRDMR